MDSPMHATRDVPPFPVRWNAVKYASNPVIDVANNPDETTQTEQYFPAPIVLANGDVWVYVKGHVTRIYAWKSTDGGVTFALQNGGNAVLTVGGPGAWDSKMCLQPAAVYDQANDVIHLYYTGSDDPFLLTNVQAGHATAPGTTPTVFTKDAGNPILTPAAVSSDLGGLTVGNELTITDVIKIGSTFHFYGDVIYDGKWRLFHATGTTWNNPSGTSIVLSAPVAATDPGGNIVVQVPTVFKYRSLYAMIYSLGGGQPAYRALRTGFSTDGVAWTFQGDSILAPGPLGAWDSAEAYCASLLKSSVAPFSDPVVGSDGRWKLYYSGYNGVAAIVGLAYLSPS